MQKSLKQDIHLGFWRNVTLILLPDLIVLSKAEFVGQVQDEVWREIATWTEILHQSHQCHDAAFPAVRKECLQTFSWGMF